MIAPRIGAAIGRIVVIAVVASVATDVMAVPRAEETVTASARIPIPFFLSLFSEHSETLYTFTYAPTNKADTHAHGQR